MAIVASARQTNEELYLLRKLADKVRRDDRFGSATGEGDKLLLNPGSQSEHDRFAD